MAINYIDVTWNEDGSATILGRLTARGGSGAATGVEGEGNWLEQADISSITLKVFDVDSETPNTPVRTATLTIADVILDTPVTSNVIWTRDTVGYNLIYDAPNTDFPTPNNRYDLEFTVVLQGGITFHGVYQGQTRSIRSG